MAENKVKRWWPALAHAFVYSLGFLFLHPSCKCLLVILSTHYFIDRYRLARYVVFFKNQVFGNWFLTGNELYFNRWKDTDKIKSLGADVSYEGCHVTGYPAYVPKFLSFWLTTIVDNIIHITINALALRYL
jgi:hypothetical protein